jgi:hypothetical protein
LNNLSSVALAKEDRAILHLHLFTFTFHLHLNML